MTDARKALESAREALKLMAEMTGGRADDEYVWGVQAEVDAAIAALAETVWIVGASVGEYSDRSVWTVGVWRDKATAESFITAIDALGREYVEANRRWLDIDDADDDLYAAIGVAEEACRALDPGWSSYSGDAPIYSAWQEKVIAAAPPAPEPRS